MEKTTIEIIQLVASDGMVLTDGDAYSKSVYLGIYDKPENWHEITEQEYQEIKAKEEEEEMDA
jgi:hypothetical protein